MSFYIDSAILGLEYGFLALGVYITFRVLNIPDLTVDGSFTLGMAVSAVIATAGHPWLALLAAILVGAAAGVVTGFLQTKAGIHPILAGILTMSGLYTVNITVLGGPNVSLLNAKKIFQLPENITGGLSTDTVKVILLLLICAVCITTLALFFKTVLGLCIRAAGNNERMVKASSINTVLTRITAIALANGMVALSGGILAQYQGFADVNSGSGMIVIGLASVIIGEVITGRRSLTVGLISAVIGSVIYRILIAIALETDLLSSNGLKLVSAVIVAITLSIPKIKEALAERRTRKEAMKDA